MIHGFIRAIAPAAFLALSSSQDAGLPKGIDLSKELGVELSEIQPLGAADPATLEKVAKVSGVSKIRLEGIRRFRAKGQGRGGSVEELKIAYVPLEGELKGARLHVAMGPEGRIAYLGVWGTKDLDEDPTGAWGVFLGQFRRGGLAMPDLATARPAADADVRLAKLSADSPEQAAVAKALLRQRMLMRENNFRLNRINARLREGEVSADSWDPELARVFAELAKISTTLEPLIGESGAAVHHRAANEVVGNLAVAAEAFSHGDGAKARQSAGMLRESCGSCHAATDHELGGKLQNALGKEREKLGFADVYARVGIDVWPAPGRLAASQEIAEAIRAGALLLPR